MTGKIGSYQLGILNMQTKSIESEKIPAYNFSVVRVKKNISGDDSYAGGIITNKVSTDTNTFNRLVGFDFGYRLNDHWKITGLGVISYDDALQNTDNRAYNLTLHKETSRGFEP